MPDAITLAKGLGGGVPIGALVTFGPEVSGLLTAGQHGSTFGGNPLAAAAGLAVLDTIEERGPARPRPRGGASTSRGRRALGHPLVTGVRGAGPAPGHHAGRAGRARRSPPPPATRASSSTPWRRTPCGSPRRWSSTTDQLDAFVAALPGLLDAATTKDDLMTRHFLRDDDLTADEQAAGARSGRWSSRPRRSPRRPLDGPRVVSVLFDKPTLRTQVSFAGGSPGSAATRIVVDGNLAQIGTRESIADVARVLGPQSAAIVWRTYGQDRHRGDGRPRRGARRQRAHRRLPPVPDPRRPARPCPSTRAHSPGLTVAYVGDGANNMAHSYLLGCALAGMHVRIGTPASHQPRRRRSWRVRRRSPPSTGGSVAVTADASERGRRRRRGHHRHLGVDGHGGAEGRAGRAPTARSRRIAVTAGSDGAAPSRRGLPALPAGLPRLRGRRRGHRRAAVGGLGRGREPAARAEGPARPSCSSSARDRSLPTAHRPPASHRRAARPPRRALAGRAARPPRRRTASRSPRRRCRATSSSSAP